MTDDFKQAIEAIKLRSPIEEIVRERVAGLRRAGALWQACCPFHSEKTPSFKVDPRRGTWHCYGACGTGGDVISFVERAYNVEFREALEILATRCGVALPQRRSDTAARDAQDPLYEIMERAERFYRRWLRRPEGEAALAYVRGRGLSDATIDAFGVGFAPPLGDALVRQAREQGIAVERLVELGLARFDSSGRAYDFFKGRVMFPVRDLKRRTVGFGARRLGDADPRAPKYINTPETPLFHKGRLIYALDHAIDHTRRNGHLVLVEGYTDVMAAHQVGLRGVVAVLGTALTEDHAALVRRSGARRVSLVFDGDEAGRKATLRALDGLLALDLELDIVRLPGTDDPCDVLVREGPGPLTQALERATGWFDFVAQWVTSEDGDERFKVVDQVLALFARIRKPVERDARLADFATALGVPLESVRAQFESLPERRREIERRRREKEQAHERAQRAEPEAPVDARMARAFRELAGAALSEPTLAAQAAGYAEACGDPQLKRLLQVLGELHARTLGTFAVADVFDALLGEPARDLIVPLLEHASQADRADALFAGATECIEGIFLERRVREQVEHLRAGDGLRPEQLRELHERLRARIARGQHV